tara:strand:+ start:11 stop:574 length:564 start_codon:yes stop_codon:yes gene_type:complete
MKEQDQKWRDAIVQGGPEAEKAFSELSVFYGPKLYAQVFKILKTDNITKDVLQDVFIKIWLNIEQFQGKSSFYSWIFRIAHNEAISTFKREKRKAAISLDHKLIEILPGHSSLEGQNPDQILGLLNEATNTLPKKQALVFELKYFQNLSYKEIQEITGTSQGALKASFHLAKEKISTFLSVKLNLLT